MFLSFIGLISPDAQTIYGLKNFNDGLRIYSSNQLYFLNTANNRYVSFQAATGLTTSTTYTLPELDGASGYALKTDGSGNLYWGVTASGTASIGVSNVLPLIGNNQGDLIWHTEEGTLKIWYEDAKKAADAAWFDSWVGQNAKQVGIAIGSGKKLADIARASIGNVVSALGDKALTEAGLLYAAGDIPSAAAMVAAGVAAYATAGVLGATTKKAAASTPATAAPAPVPQNISYNLRVDAAFADGELVARQFARMQREAGRRGFVTAGAY